MSPFDPQRPKSRFSLDKFKKHILRTFRHHLDVQFKAIFQGKQYHWVMETKRNNVREFFLAKYNVPTRVYSVNESVFFKLLMNTVKNVETYGIRPNPEVDKAIDGAFRQSPCKKNIKIILSNEAIRGLWVNQWGGLEVPFLQSILMRRILESTDPIDILKFHQMLLEQDIDSQQFFPQDFGIDRLNVGRVQQSEQDLHPAIKVSDQMKMEPQID